MRTLAFLVPLLALFHAQAALAEKLDVAADIPVFQEFVRNENQELARLEDVQRGMENGETGCAAGREAAAIVENYKKTLLVAASAQDLLVGYVFSGDNLTQLHQYIWTRINRMRLLTFSYLTGTQKALANMAKNGSSDVPPVFESAEKRMEDVLDALKELEIRFAPLAAPSEPAESAQAPPAS